MELPILQVGRVLIVSMQTDMDDALVLKLQDKLLRKIEISESSGVVIDLSRVEIMDSFMCRTLSDISKMACLMGAQVVLTGIQASVAIAMIELGITPQEVPTRLTLDKGLAYLANFVN